jgi:hypothetical protein
MSVFVITLIMMYVIHMVGLMRVSEENELQGARPANGIPAYPEYVLHGSAAPQRAPAFHPARVPDGARGHGRRIREELTGRVRRRSIRPARPSGRRIDLLPGALGN